MFSTEHPSPSNLMENSSMFTDDLNKEIIGESSTPELNLLLDKLTEILRFRSACRRRYHHPSSVPGNLKRLQLTSNEPYNSHTNEISSSCSSSPSSSSSSSSSSRTGAATAIVETEATFVGTTGGASKSSHVQSKPSIANRPSSHHHHHHHSHHHHHAHHHHRHHQNHLKLFTNEKKRRLPCLLQRLIDDGNLIKEAVRRLKSQRFPAACQQQQQQQQQLTMGDSPSTSSMKSSFPLLSTSVPISSSLNNSPSQSASSPNVNLSWFLSSNVVFSPVNHPSENGSPMRTLMEIGIHDG